ncbi:MAG: ribosome maturation factor RimM [Treponema sp.]
MEWLITGRIRGAFGLEGYVKIESSSGEYGHFLKIENIQVVFPKSSAGTGMQYFIEDCIIRASDALIKLRGIDTPEAAKQFQGANILVPRDMACPLNEGEFYIKDLCNTELVYEGTPVGTITDIVEGGGGSLIELSEAATGKIKYIPFRREFIGEIDIRKKQVELMHRWILE